MSPWAPLCISGNISLAPLNMSTVVADVPDLSNPSSNNNTVQAELRQNDGQKDLPYWMIKDAEDLHNYYLTIKIPEIYKATTKSICHAGATSIDLSRLSKNFYEFGMHMSTLDDDNTIGTLLLDMARQRLAALFNTCNYQEGDSRKERNFENHEKKLFEIGCENFANVRRTGWEEEEEEDPVTYHFMLIFIFPFSFIRG